MNILPMPQFFPFHENLIRYIQNYSKFEILEKLSQTCRLFSFLYPYDKIIMIMKIYKYTEENVFNHELVECKSIADLREYGKKIWLKEELNILMSNIPLNSLSSVISRCSAKLVEVSQTISLKDFKLLTNSKRVKTLDIYEILDDDGNPLPVEQIITSVPNADKISISQAYFSSNSLDRLAIMKRDRKLHKFELNNVQIQLDVLLLNTFLKNNAIPDVDVWIQFDNNIYDDITEFRFNIKLKNTLSKSMKKAEASSAGT